MTRTLKHILQGGSVIVLTDEQREWFGDYIITHINQHHKGRPFFPIVQIKHLHDMIDSSSKDGGIVTTIFGILAKKMLAQILLNTISKVGIGFLMKMIFLAPLMRS